MHSKGKFGEFSALNSLENSEPRPLILNVLKKGAQIMRNLKQIVEHSARKPGSRPKTRAIRVFVCEPSQAKDWQQVSKQTTMSWMCALKVNDSANELQAQAN